MMQVLEDVNNIKFNDNEGKMSHSLDFSFTCHCCPHTPTSTGHTLAELNVCMLSSLKAGLLAETSSTLLFSFNQCLISKIITVNTNAAPTRMRNVSQPLRWPLLLVPLPDRRLLLLLLLLLPLDLPPDLLPNL